MKRYRAVQLFFPKPAFKEFGIWETFWGTDIFVHQIPLVKTMIFVNVLIWLVVGLTQ